MDLVEESQVYLALSLKTSKNNKQQLMYHLGLRNSHSVPFLKKCHVAKSNLDQIRLKRPYLLLVT